jgi:hypothetical protein
MEKIVKLAKIRANPYTDYIQNAFWPNPEVFSARKCDSRLIGDDLNGFTNTLGRLLNEEYLPTIEDIKSTVGIPDYLDGDDYLFLRYVTKPKVHVEVQEGRGVYILMSCSDWPQGRLAQIETFVKAIAIKTIKIPKDSGIVGGPVVFVSAIDIGPSRCGSLAWKLEGESLAAQTNWYSQIMWWSDGTKVLFAISTMSKDDYAKLATVANRTSQREPHRFIYRK